MFKKNDMKPKKRYKLVIRQKRSEDDIVTIDYSNARKIRYKYSKRKKWIKAVIIGFDSQIETVEYTDVIGVSKIRY